MQHSYVKAENFTMSIQLSLIHISHICQSFFKPCLQGRPTTKCPPICSLFTLLLLKKTKGENKTKKFMGQDKDSDINKQIPFLAKQTCLGKMNVIHCQLKQSCMVKNKEKLKQHLTHAPTFYSRSTSLFHSQVIQPPTHTEQHRGHEDKVNS